MQNEERTPGEQKEIIFGSTGIFPSFSKKRLNDFKGRVQDEVPWSSTTEVNGILILLIKHLPFKDN